MRYQNSNKSFQFLFFMCILWILSLIESLHLLVYLLLFLMNVTSHFYDMLVFFLIFYILYFFIFMLMLFVIYFLYIWLMVWIFLGSTQWLKSVCFLWFDPFFYYFTYGSLIYSLLCLTTLKFQGYLKWKVALRWSLLDRKWF